MPEIQRPLKVFLFHTPGDKTAARELYLHLIQDGLDAWLVKDRLLPGQDWEHELHGAAREADVMIACLSERFDRDEFEKKEIRRAFDMLVEGLDGETLVIPARLEECDGPVSLRRWEGVDLFEEAGYETLMETLQARARHVGASIQRKEGSLPQIVRPEAPSEERVPETQPVEAGREVLVEGPAVTLRGPVPPRTSRRALVAALIGFTGILMMAMLGPARLERYFAIVRMAALDPSPTSTPEEKVSPTVVLPLISIPTSTAKGKPLNIVLLIDTTSSMQGSEIGMVKSAVADFIPRLNNRYPVSVIQFDSNIELQIGLTRDPDEAGEAVRSITADSDDNSPCLLDALYAALQESARVPAAKDTRNMVILFTDSVYKGDPSPDCVFDSTETLATLAAEHPVSIFIMQVGRETDFEEVLAPLDGTFFAVGREADIQRALLSIAEATLDLEAESKTSALLSAGSTTARHTSMVFVPPGEFTMGTKRIYLDAFWIDKTEVTNAMYAACVQAGQCTTPHSYRSSSRSKYYDNIAFDDYPVIQVSWTDASNYCTWAGARLPSEAEWEKAARGTDARPYPWGSGFPRSGNQLNFQSLDTIRVGSYPNGASPYGALDMAGNVAEWVADWFSLPYYSNPPTAANPPGPESGEYRVWRGGSWAHSSPDALRTDSRTGNLPTDYNDVIGFRCARDAGP